MLVCVSVGMARVGGSSSPGRRDGARVTPGIDWRSCGVRLQCARVRVPLDWAHPGGPTISLTVVRFVVRRPIGSLFVNFGGPGVPGVATLRAAPVSQLDALSQGRFDVVSWDPRGTGESTHVRCFANKRSQERFWGTDWSVPTTTSASRRYLNKTIAFVKRCVALTGRLLAHDSTADSARDLDYLRRLVGDRKLNYLGVSYGTFLGQTYANMFSGRVRAMVLDGVVDPIAFTTSTEAQIANGVSDSDLVFAKFLSLCHRAGPARCALAGHGPVAARVSRLLARLRRGPIPAPSAAPPRRLSYGDLLIDVFAQLGSPAEWPHLASGLEQAARGDGSSLERDFQRRRPAYQSSLNSAVALQCADKPLPRQGPSAWPTVIARLSRISQLEGPVNGWWLWAPCASWPVASTDRYTGPWTASTRHPIVVVGTRFDPQTPYANARRVTRLLGNAVLLTYDGYGHTSDNDPSTCVEHAINRYLVALVAPRPGTACQANQQPFDPGFGAGGS
jgi:pimeloyl-ACP methyl ester carboxylesterase